MAAVSRSCLHICQELTVQEKMGSVVCRVFFFNIVLFQPACVGDACVFFFAVLLLLFFYSQMLMFRKHLIGFLVRFSQEKI